MNNDSGEGYTVGDASGWIYDEAVQCLRRAYGDTLEALRVERVVVGVFVTGVKLSNGQGGVAFTSPEIIQQAGTSLLRSPVPAMRGLSAMAVARGQDVGPFSPVIRLATLNALSVPLLAERAVGTQGDDLAAYRPLFAGRRICMVGAIIPLIKELRQFGPAEVLVADRKSESLAAVQGATPIPLERLPEALRSCQTAIFTGATIPNGSLSGLLDLLSPQAVVILAGPTAGFVPEPLFRRGVALVATTIVTDADRGLDVLAEGGGMYQLFGGCAQKIKLPNSDRMRQLGFHSVLAPSGPDTREA
ncbi:MAG: DUF364 domain-containing protein [Solidesulfovibrio sp.]